ncbi:MAG: winged helix-turn-helix transcriptional regulator [Candidatus Hydrogenedentes bacterium]|nr:winged helix-turn-helix transcriptional regulator [Candidatus Hydrogenedentota bacterium]
MNTPDTTPHLDTARPPDMEERIRALKASRERILIRLVTAISRSCSIYGARTIRHLGLSISQIIVLGEVLGNNGCRQEELRVYVALDKGNVTRALQRLEEMGLVTRKNDPADRRVVRVYVTEKALSIEGELFTLAGLLDDKLTAGFSREERETLINYLLRMEATARALARSDDAQAEPESS